MALLKEVVSKPGYYGNGKVIRKAPPIRRFIPDPAKEYNGKFVFETQFMELLSSDYHSRMAKPNKVFLTDFPSGKALRKFIEESNEGDALFIHQLSLMNGSFTYGGKKQDLLGVMEGYVEKLKEKNLSVYSCHIPFATLNPLSTTLAVAEKIKGKVTGGCVFNDKKDKVSLVICELASSSADSPGGLGGVGGLGSGLEILTDVSKLGSTGEKWNKIKKAAIVAGDSRNKAEWKKEAEKRGADIYITVNQHHRAAQCSQEQSNSTAAESNSGVSIPCMSVSVYDTDYILKKQLMKTWLEDNLNIATELLT